MGVSFKLHPRWPCILLALLLVPVTGAESGIPDGGTGDSGTGGQCGPDLNALAGFPAGQLADPEMRIIATTPDGAFVAEKANFTVIHLEGDPSTIGRNHGTLLAEKMQRGMDAYAHCSELWYGLSWSQCRNLALPYWPTVPSEYQLEIQGIAAGAASAGVKSPSGGTVDWIDVLAYNAVWDVWWRVSQPGNPTWWWPFRNDGEKTTHHCSGFVCTGNYTADGGFVLAQSLWMPYFLPPAQAVWCDLVPDKGYRISMQLTAGMIWSGTEYYINSEGLVAAETTLGVGGRIPTGTPAFVRVRRAIQYAKSIDEFRDQMLKDTNGAYCSDYMLADAKTNEVAVLELGGRTWALARTSDGFLPSCNYPWDPKVAEEMGEVQGPSHGCYPRWTRLLDLAEMNKGNITCEFGKATLGDHYDSTVGDENPSGRSLCGHGENTTRGFPHGSQDAKVTNRTMAKRMQAWARFGHSCGRPFFVDEHATAHPDYAFDDLRDMIPGPWATFGPVNQLEINVRDGNGAPVNGARIILRDVYDGSKLNYTAENGKCLVPYFPVGEYNVTAISGNLQSRMRVVIEGPRSLEMTLREGSDANSASTGPILAAVAIAVVLAALLFVRSRRKKKMDQN